MLDVFLTADVEVWCDGWNDIDAKFPAAFQRYMYGPTARGEYGLPYQIKVLQAHALTGVYFVEPLFSCRFGVEPLAEVVHMLSAGGQEVQLHLHTEWVDEARQALLEGVQGKRQHLRYFSLQEQVTLIRAGQRLLSEAGAASPNAFRAGSFALNQDTLEALVACGIHIDSSYNASMNGVASGIMPSRPMLDVTRISGLHEIPMTVFHDGLARLRHTQLTACSYSEIESLLWSALETGRKSFVLLLHNFELLDPSMTRPDMIVVKRFHRLCEFLDRHRDSFHVRGFRDWPVPAQDVYSPMLSVPFWATGRRLIEQAYRRRLR
jgi:hypothetical protein